MAEDQHRQGLARQFRHRHAQPCGRHLPAERDRRALAAGTVSQRRPVDAGPRRRQHRHHARHARSLDAAGPLRQHQGLRGDRQEPHRGRARDPDHRRSGPAGLLFLVLARALGAQGHAADDHRQAQRRRRRRRSPIRRVQAEARRPRAGHFPARAAHAPGARRFHKAEIEKWWPVIKAAGIKAE